jgi:hypothetical protein
VSLLWPQEPDPEPGIFNRLGRVIHWTFTGTAAAFGIGGLNGVYEALTSTSEYGPDWTSPMLAGAFAAFLFVLGRAARYIFSNE